MPIQKKLQYFKQANNLHIPIVSLSSNQIHYIFRSGFVPSSMMLNNSKIVLEESNVYLGERMKQIEKIL